MRVLKGERGSVVCVCAERVRRLNCVCACVLRWEGGCVCEGKEVKLCKCVCAKGEGG